MRSLDRQIPLEEREEDSVPNGPQSVQVEASLPVTLFPLPDPHRATGETLSWVWMSFVRVAGAHTRGGHATRIQTGVETRTRRLRNRTVGRVEEGAVLLVAAGVVVDE